MNQELFDYIAACPSAFHTTAHSAQMLDEAGYLRLHESDSWELTPGKGYYVTRNGSSLIAFRVPKESFTGFMITAAHGDSPAYRIKENPEAASGKMLRLSVETYGGMIASTWMDRPLSVAGRITVRTDNGMDVRLVDLKEPCAVIPNVAIHMNRSINESMAFNPAVDMLPLWESVETGTFRARVAANAGVKEEDILTWDLMVYNPQRGVEFGEYISAPRLDDLQCAFSTLKAFLASHGGKAMPVCCIFDNEEVGSQTKQGAASTFLYDTLERVCEFLNLDQDHYRRMVAGSLFLSCDNAHAVHPNHPEYADKNHAVEMNGGIVIKYNASQRYITDAVSAGLFKLICDQVGAPTQVYANRADIKGGFTLGSVVNTQISANSADIGLAQLAMHSSYETAGARDTETMVRAITEFFQSAIVPQADGCYSLL